jgi:hypothetical protein
MFCHRPVLPSTDSPVPPKNLNNRQHTKAFSLSNRQHTLTLISHVSMLSVAGMALIKKPHSSVAVYTGQWFVRPSGSCGPLCGPARLPSSSVWAVASRRTPRPPPHEHNLNRSVSSATYARTTCTTPRGEDG